MGVFIFIYKYPLQVVIMRVRAYGAGRSSHDSAADASSMEPSYLSVACNGLVILLLANMSTNTPISICESSRIFHCITSAVTL